MADPCSSTALAIAAAISLIWLIVAEIPLMASTASLVEAWIEVTWAPICPRCLCGLLGEALDLGGHHGKALAGLARARRLDGGVERQQIGLRGNVVDQA